MSSILLCCCGYKVLWSAFCWVRGPIWRRFNVFDCIEGHLIIHTYCLPRLHTAIWLWLVQCAAGVHAPCSNPLRRIWVYGCSAKNILRTYTSLQTSRYGRLFFSILQTCLLDFDASCVTSCQFLWAKNKFFSWICKIFLVGLYSFLAPEGIKSCCCCFFQVVQEELKSSFIFVAKKALKKVVCANRHLCVSVCLDNNFLTV